MTVDFWTNMLCVVYSRSSLMYIDLSGEDYVSIL